MALAGWIGKLVERRRGEPTADQSRATVRKMIGTCPVCSSDLAGHHSAEVASVFACDMGKRTELKHAMETGNWPAALRCRQWSANADVIEWWAIRCNRGGELGVLGILFTAELLGDDVVQDRRRLPPTDSARLSRLIGARWSPL